METGRGYVERRFKSLFTEQCRQGGMHTMLTTAVLEQYAKECAEKDKIRAKEVVQDVLSRRIRMERHGMDVRAKSVRRAYA
jgi:predicted kinase